eukprot:PITA_30779
MQLSLERELKLHAEEEISIPKEEELQIDAKQPHAKDPGVETSTHAETSRYGQKRSREADRWLYKVKQVVDGSVEEHKARFVAWGFSPVEGIEYDETFAPIVRYSSIRSMLALSNQMGWNIHQMDVKTKFLNGKIEEEVYIEQPEGFEVFDHESQVCRLKRALCGLK